MSSSSQHTTNISQNTWIYVWGMTPSVVGHVGIQIGGEKPGDPKGIYKSVHPSLPVFGPLIVYPVPVHTATSWQEDAESEGRARGLTDEGEGATVPPPLQRPDAVFHTTSLNTTMMQSIIESESSASNGIKYQLIPGIHPWNFFNRAAEDITYQPMERREYSLHSSMVMKKHSPPKAYNCATFVSQVLKSGGLQLQETIFPWQMSPNSVWSQLSKNQDFTRVDVS